MPSLPDDQWPADDPVLASFAEDLRIIAAGPAPEPRPGLVATMRQGAAPFDSPAAGKRKRMLTKTIVGGLAVKLAVGVGVAAASVTLAGATGVLPEPAQDVVASVVAAATPFELPDPGVNLQVGGDTSSSSTSTTVADDDDEGTAARKANHGACVSTVAKDKVATEGADPNSHGKTVSSVARSDCGKKDKEKEKEKEKGSPSSTTSTTVGSSSTTSSSTTSTTVASSSQRGNNSGPGNSANRGKGNSGKN